MQWEKLNAGQFEEARTKSGGVCILPLGVLEYHGSHLPLGTDVFRAQRMACDVAEVEPAIVFPALPFGANVEAKIFPGSVVFENELVFSLLENVCDEISRNGFHKILLLSGHGGNKWLLPQFVLSMLDKEKDYVVYYPNSRGVDPDAVGGYMDKDLFYATFETKEYGHACEWETSEVLHIHPELVDMDEAKTIDEQPQDRLDHLPNTYTPMDWFSRSPGLTRGTPGYASAEKGKIFWQQQVEALSSLVRAIKEDQVATDLYAEFSQRIYRR